MKQTRFDEAQIIDILKQQEAGVTVATICREHAISEGTFYRLSRSHSKSDARG